MPSDIDVNSAVPQTVDMKPDPTEQTNALWGRQAMDNIGYLYNIDFPFLNQTPGNTLEYDTLLNPTAGTTTLVSYGVVNILPEGTIKLRLYATGTTSTGIPQVIGSLFVDGVLVIVGTGDSNASPAGTVMEYATVLDGMVKGLKSATLFGSYNGTVMPQGGGNDLSTIHYLAGAHCTFRIGEQSGT